METTAGNDPKSGPISKKSRIVTRLAFIGAGLLLFFIVAAVVFNQGMGKIRSLTITTPALSNISDGEHRGTYCAGRWCYDVTVTVKEHKISDIKFNDDKMRMFKDLHVTLIKKIIEQQRIDIDGISGATITSKAFLKAVENAVNSR
jgi:uncharacterized protein with FMN-binding domain